MHNRNLRWSSPNFHRTSSDDEIHKESIIGRSRETISISKSISAPNSRTPAENEEIAKRKEKVEERRSCLTEKKSIQRMNVLEEIYETERAYIENLHVISSIQTLLHDNELINKVQENQLFSNVESLLSIHKDIFTTLDAKFSSTPHSECWQLSMGDFFFFIAANVTEYAIYVTDQIVQSELVDSFISTNKPILQMIHESIPQFDCKSFVVSLLRSYLFMPVQRLCKYPLLIRELIKATHDGHRDKAILERAMIKIEEATVEVNHQQQEFLSHQKILQLSQHLLGVPNEFSFTNRTFLLEGDLIKISGAKSQERKFYLFNDCLVYGARSFIMPSKIIMKGSILLQFVDLADIPASQETNVSRFAFRLYRSDIEKQYIIRCKDYAEKSHWMRMIEDQAIKSRPKSDAPPLPNIDTSLLESN